MRAALSAARVVNHHDGVVSHDVGSDLPRVGDGGNRRVGGTFGDDGLGGCDTIRSDAVS